MVNRSCLPVTALRQTMVQSPGTWPFYAILAYKKLSTVPVQWSAIHFQFQLSKYLWLQVPSQEVHGGMI